MTGVCESNNVSHAAERLSPSTDALIQSIVRLWRQINRNRRLQFIALLGLICVCALAEMVTVGSVFSFLGVLTSPQVAFDHPVGKVFSRVLSINSAQELLLPVTLLFASAALAAGALRLLMLWSLNRLAFNTGADLSIDVFRSTLYQPYQTHTSHNSSEVIAAIINKVNDVMFGVMLSILQFISSVVIVIALTVVLMMLAPLVAAGVGFFLGGSYALVVKLARKELDRRSRSIAREQVNVLKALQEGLGGIRDVILDGLQNFYCGIFGKSIQPLRRAQGDIAFISQAPRYVLEAIGICAIATLAYNLSTKAGGVASVLPALGAMALGAQRLLPALQSSYGSWVSMVGSRASLIDVLELLERPVPKDKASQAGGPFSLREGISFEQVRFRYTPQAAWVLDGFNLHIAKGVRVGLVGRTGSGKSTILDLLMGLLDPVEGRVLVDGQSVLEVREAWQKTVAHVPQSIYLADTTLAENIAFGVPADAIDMSRVKEAARQAQLHDFIVDLPEKYLERVGERGVRLSGGQRQRIGIARALYKHASVLVFDEATSALDNETERAVMDAIHSLRRELTVILIAHRLTTVRNCDVVIEIDNGRAVAQGSFDQLLAKSESFRRMAATDTGKSADLVE